MSEQSYITAASLTRTTSKAEVSKVPNSVVFTTIVLILLALWAHQARNRCMYMYDLAIDCGQRVMVVEVIIPGVSLCLPIIAWLLYSLNVMHV